MQFIKAEDRPDNLFIEATGVADPGSLIALFRQEEVQKYFEIQPVLCLVDAEVVEEWIEDVPEVSRQISASDVILINKKSLVTTTYASHLMEWLQSINPFATVELVDQANYSFQNMEAKVSHSTFISESQLTSSKSPHAFKSMMFEFDQPFDKDLLLNQLTVLFFLSYHQIYRVKGTVLLEDGSFELVQSHGRQIDMYPTNTENSKNNGQPSLTSKLIVIGKGIKREALAKVFARATIKEDLTKA